MSGPQIRLLRLTPTSPHVKLPPRRLGFDHIIASLLPEFATDVRDLILRPPAERPYDTLREQLTKRTAASEQRKFQQLFTTEELGDRKPTQLLCRMQQLLGDRPGITDGAFLRELFLQRLPSNVRMVLASTPDASLEKVAELADKIMEVATPSVSAVAMHALMTEVEQLHTEVTWLQRLVASLCCIALAVTLVHPIPTHPAWPPQPL